MIVTAVLALVAVHLSFAEGRCVETYTRYETYYTTSRHIERCWILWQCSYYTRASRQRSVLSYRCCTNWQGSDCSIPVCHGSTECPNGGTCQSPNQCSCITGFASPTCADVNECASNNGGCAQICTNTHGSFKCSCRSGYILNSDQKTCIDVDECYAKTDDCQQKCKNVPGTFSCACNDGYALNTDGKTCRDKDECRENGGSVCEHNCTNTIGSFTCSCASGFNLDLDRIHCKDDDECLNSQVCDHQCQNTVGSYSCSCNAGYALQSDGSSCSDNNECETNNGNCQDTCVNIPGSYTCSCSSGYDLNADQHTCDDIDECGRGISGCSHVCSNTIGSFECDCPEGFRLNSDNKTCKDIDDCAVTECYNGGTCIDAILSFSCLCSEGYTGKQCETGITPFKSFVESSCVETYTQWRTYYTTSRIQETCWMLWRCSSYTRASRQQSVLGYRCCTNWQGSDCSTHINECEGNNGDCQHICTNTHSSFECSCRSGYILNSDQKTCIASRQDPVEDNKGVSFMTIIKVAGGVSAGVVIAAIVVTLVIWRFRSKNARMGESERSEPPDSNANGYTDLDEFQHGSENIYTEIKSSLNNNEMEDTELREFNLAPPNTYIEHPMDHIYENLTLQN